MNQFHNIVLYANKLDDRTGQMSDLFIVERGPEATSMIFAKQGNILVNNVESTVTFQLHDGTIHRQQSELDTTYQLIHFHDYDVQPDLTSLDDDDNGNSIERKQRPKEMRTASLWQKINTLKHNHQDNSKLHAMQAELHSRITTPMAPLLFALFGLPFSIQAHRSGRSGGFVIGLIIYLCYYLLLSLAGTVTAETGLSPWFTFWIPHAVLLLVSLYCLKQSANERPNIVINWIEQLLIALRTKIKAHHADH